MKIKNILFFVLFVIIYSCSNKDEIFIPSKITGNLNVLENSSLLRTNGEANMIVTFKVDSTNEIIKVESSIQNNHLNSILKIKYENSEWIQLSDFSINMTDKEYKKNVNLIIENKASQLKARYDYKKIRDIENIIDILPKLLFEELGEKKYFKETTLGIFYHLGILKSAMRSYENNTKDCNCGVFESFVNEESPFFCSEDKVVSVNSAIDLVNKISNKSEFAGKKFIPQKTLKYLKSKSGEFLSVSKIDKILKDEFRYFWNNDLSKKDIRTKIFPKDYTIAKEATLVMASDSEDGGFPYDPTCLLYGASSGADCGCCGNYSGPCWKCLLECYIHDQTCETCEPSWYCFSGCIPSKC